MAQQNELFELLKSGGKIVSSASCTVLEIAEAMSCNRMYVDKDGFGFVYFPSKVKPSTETIHRRTTKEQTKKLQEGLQLYAKNNPTALVATMAQQTPKHKAKELYDYYLVLFSDVDYVIAKKKAKMCVRKAIDEILSLVSDDLDLYYKDCIYWEQVKTELEKL
jgi:hypothetical protein